MTTQLTIPPARVWERIEKILDEQDSCRKHTDKLIYDTLNTRTNPRQTNYIMVTFMAISLLALMTLKFKYSTAFKHN